MLYGAVTKPLIADGTANGILTIDDVGLFYPNALVTLVSPMAPTLNLIVVDLISRTEFLVRDLYAATFNTYKDVSAYRVSDGAQVMRPLAAISNVSSVSLNSGIYTNGTDVVLDFGPQGSDFLSTTVTGQGWVTPTAVMSVTIVDNNRAQEAVLEQIHLSVENLIPGVGFDILAHAPNGLFYGTLNIRVMGTVS